MVEFLISCIRYDACNFTISRGRKKLEQKETSIFSKLHKENNKNNENVFTFLIFYLLCSFIFIRPLQKDLMLHYVHTFIMFKHVNFGNHIWIYTTKIKKACPFKNFIPGWSIYMSFFVFFSSRDKFYLCLFDRDEFITG